MATARILFVEDDEPTRTVISSVLRGEGYDVDACADADEALARLGSRHDDVLLTDHILPGLSGLDLVRRSRALHHDLRCVVASGAPPPPERERAAVTWLTKPLALERLLRAIGPG